MAWRISICDKAGLVDRAVAQEPAAPPHTTSPGHDKVVPPGFFLAQDPEYMQVKMFWGEHVQSSVMQESRAWIRHPLARRYAAVLHPFPAEGEFPDRVLLTWERIDDGRPPEEHWQEFEESLARHPWPE